LVSFLWLSRIEVQLFGDVSRVMRRDAIRDARRVRVPGPDSDEPPALALWRRSRQALLGKIADQTDHGKFIAGAAICFAVFGERTAKYYLEDCCAATENLILGLWAYGIGSCWVAGDKKPYADDIRKLLSVPDNYTLVSLVPAGYPAEVTVQKKKLLDDVTFVDTYSEN